MDPPLHAPRSFPRVECRAGVIVEPFSIGEDVSAANNAIKKNLLWMISLPELFHSTQLALIFQWYIMYYIGHISTSKFKM